MGQIQCACERSGGDEAGPPVVRAHASSFRVDQSGRSGMANQEISGAHAKQQARQNNFSYYKILD